MTGLAALIAVTILWCLLLWSLVELWSWLDDREASVELGYDIRHYIKTGEKRSVR